MKYSIIPYKNLNNNLRIDSEYFSKEYLEIESLLKKSITIELNECSYYIKKGIFDISPERYKTVGTPLIRTTEIKNPLIDFSSTVYLDDTTQKEFITTQLRARDIVFTKIGAYIGDVAYLPKTHQLYNFSQNVAGIKINNNKIIPEYLLCYFLSKYGNLQIKRAIMLSGQGKLELEDIRNFKVVLLSDKFQNICKSLVDITYKINKNSQNLYKQSEELLLKELGLLNWQPEHKLYSVKKYSEVEQANRFDAEYFQPKYDEIIDKVKSYKNGVYKFDKVIDISDKNIEPENDIEYKYIELANISKNGEITGSTNDLGKNLPTRARRIVKTNDLIVSSIEGSLDSIALITEEYDKSFCSNGFYVLNSTIYNSETLLCLLKIIVGQMQLKRGCSGTILTAISKEELNKILLPKIPTKLQKQIKLNIQEMYANKYKSKQLLEIAKRGVEIAIEENEETATNWVNNELSKI